jgi:hypothetical protein
MAALEKAIGLRLRSRQEISTEQCGTDWNRTIQQLAKERQILNDTGLNSSDVAQRIDTAVPGQQPQQTAPAAPGGSTDNTGVNAPEPA